MQRREVADLRTRFSVEGLAAARTAFRETASAVMAVRQSTEAYSKATKQSVVDSQAQLVAAREAARAAQAQVEATRQANNERLTGARTAGQGFIAASKKELDDAVAAQKGAERTLRAIRRPRQFAGEDAWTKYRQDREAALASVAVAKNAAAAKAAAYRSEIKTAKETADEVKAANEDALAVAVAAARGKARAEEQAADRVERAVRDTRKAEVQQSKAAADQVKADATAKIAVQKAEQRVALEAARQREQAIREQRQAEARAARERAQELRHQEQDERRGLSEIHRENNRALRELDRKRREVEREERQKTRKEEQEAAHKDQQEKQARDLAERRALRAKEQAERAAIAKASREKQQAAREAVRLAREQSRQEAAAAREVARAQAVADREQRAAIAKTTREKQQAARESVRLAREQSRQEAAAARETSNAIAEAMKPVKSFAAATRDFAIRWAKRGAMTGASLATIGTAGFAMKATGDASQYARDTFNYSRSSGLHFADFQVLTDAAEKFGVDLGDLRGSLIQFQGQLRSVAENPDTDLGRYFKDMGISVTDANGRMRQTSDVLKEVIHQSQRLDGAAQMDFLSKAFGEDDSGKLKPLFDTMNQDPEFLQRVQNRQQQLGNFITNDDLIVAYRYNNAIKDLGNAWKGVKLEVANAVGNDVSNILTALANDIGRNRVLIATYFRRAFDNFYSVTRDITRAVFNGAEFGAANAENPWVGSMLRGYITLRDAIGTTVRFAREARAAIEGRDDQVKEFPWIIGVRDGVTRAVTDVRRFAFELKSALFGEEYNVGTAQFPWIFAIKTAFQVLVADVKLQWQDLVAVWSGEQATTALGGWLQPLMQVFGQAKAVVVEFGETVGKIWSDLSKIWKNFGDSAALGGEAFNYERLKAAGQGFYFLANAAQEAWGWFSKLYTVVFDLFRDYLGLNFESVVFFGALLTFTGTARVLTFLLSGLGKLIGLLWTPLGKLIGVLGAGAGLAGVIGGVGGAVTTAGAAAAAATTKWGGLVGVFSRVAALLGGPLGLLLGIGGAAVTAYSLFGGGKGPMDKLAEDMDRINSEFAKAREQYEKDLRIDRRGDAGDRSRFSSGYNDPLPANDDPSAYVMGPNGQTWSVTDYNRMLREAEEQTRYDSYYAYRRQQSAATAGPSMPIPMAREPAAQPANITIDNRAGDEITIQGTFTQEELAKLRARNARSVN